MRHLRVFFLCLFQTIFILTLKPAVLFLIENSKSVNGNNLIFIVKKQIEKDNIILIVKNTHAFITHETIVNCWIKSGLSIISNEKDSIQGIF